MKPDDSIKSIKGVGDKTAAAFAGLGIYTVEDLLMYFPRSYISYDAPVDVKDISPGKRQAVLVTVNSRPEVRRVKQLTLLTFYAGDYTGTIKLMWFNCPFLRNAFHIGETYVFSGRVEYKNGVPVMTQPEYFSEEKYKAVILKMVPVYPCRAGITSKTIQKAVKASFSAIDDMTDYLPSDIREKYGIMERKNAIYKVHFPENEAELMSAIKRTAFDEFYSFIDGIAKLKEKNIAASNTFHIGFSDELAAFISDLPYRLTGAQMDAIRDIMSDMSSDNVMNRLVQGDVGSGKTIIAAAALFACARAGYQGAIMAPTEVLAAQHYRELKELFDKYGIHTALLTGSVTAKEKRLIYEGLATHTIDIIVGTNALIQEKVKYDNLALVVTDEQHRFGVRQREAFEEKGENPHVLVMSATPIPRTLAIIMYGDLDITIINEMPQGRIPIKNCVVGTEYRKSAYKFIKEQVNAGNQVYIVCPMVNESENIDAENVIEYADELKKIMGDDVRVDYLHGRMSGEEKDICLGEFYNGNTDILVTTTVIEVGINNPNATVMMVENAERFGLAQLHQLRGRVGRGDKQSYCIFMSGKRDKEVMDRLMVLKNSNDGFYIAGEDLKRRGPGDFFGVRQSGEVIFRIADIYNHSDMLQAAQEIYREYGGDFSVPEDIRRIYSKAVL